MEPLYTLLLWLPAALGLIACGGWHGRAVAPGGKEYRNSAKVTL